MNPSLTFSTAKRLLRHVFEHRVNALECFKFYNMTSASEIGELFVWYSRTDRDNIKELVDYVFEKEYQFDEHFLERVGRAAKCVARNGNMEFIEYLHELFPHYEELYYKAFEGSDSSKEAFEYLVSRVDPKSWRAPILEKAVYWGKLEYVKTLVDAGVPMLRGSFFLLGELSQRGKFDVYKYMLEVCVSYCNAECDEYCDCQDYERPGDFDCKRDKYAGFLNEISSNWIWNLDFEHMGEYAEHCVRCGVDSAKMEQVINRVFQKMANFYKPDEGTEEKMVKMLGKWPHLSSNLSPLYHPDVIRLIIDYGDYECIQGLPRETLSGLSGYLRRPPKRRVAM